MDSDSGHEIIADIAITALSLALVVLSVVMAMV
jgi:hypothetical protein